jgi:ferrous iron transport protein A
MPWLSEVTSHQKVEVIEVQSSVPVATRLRDLGLQKGAIFEVVECLPLGGPMVLRLDDTTIAIRRGDAQCIQVQLVPMSY